MIRVIFNTRVVVAGLIVHVTTKTSTEETGAEKPFYFAFYITALDGLLRCGAGDIRLMCTISRRVVVFIFVSADSTSD